MSNNGDVNKDGKGFRPEPGDPMEPVGWGRPPPPPVQPHTPTGGFILTPHCLVPEFSGQIGPLPHGYGVNLLATIVRGQYIAANRCGPGFWQGFLPPHHVNVEISCRTPGEWYSWHGNTPVHLPPGNVARFDLGTGQDFTAHWHYYPATTGVLHFEVRFLSNSAPAPFGPFAANLSF